MRMALIAAMVAACGGAAQAAVLFDFETYNDSTPLENGRRLSSVAGLFEQGVFLISSPGNEDPAIFNTNNPGPNVGGGDPDLLVNLGNAVILQNRSLLTQTTPGIYDTANDDAGGGEFTFNFINPVQLESVDLLDINGSGNLQIFLTDINGKVRTYSVPNRWTKDIGTEGPNGYDTLDLLTLAAQDGEGSGGNATAVEDAGYDDSMVVSMRIDFNGSAAIDNLSILNIVPAPSTLGLAGLGLGVVARRRRR